MNDIKQHFPIFDHQPDLVYLDSAATTLKPASIIAKEREYYEEYSANVARGLYPLSEKATAEYEQTREMVAQFINASRTEEVVFTKGTTEGINLVASSLNFPSSSVEGEVGRGLNGEEQPNEILVTIDRKSTRLNSSHIQKSRMPSSA